MICKLLPPKTPFLTWPWKQTSCLLCELKVNFSLLFDLGHFEFYLARLIAVVLPGTFALVVWIETPADFGQVTLVLLLVNQNESGRQQSKACLNISSRDKGINL